MPILRKDCYILIKIKNLLWQKSTIEKNTSQVTQVTCPRKWRSSDALPGTPIELLYNNQENNPLKVSMSTSTSPMENRFLMRRGTSIQISLKVTCKIMKYSLVMFQEGAATGLVAQLKILRLNIFLDIKDSSQVYVLRISTANHSLKQLVKLLTKNTIAVLTILSTVVI
jgi:hypothetical protein